MGNMVLLELVLSLLRVVGAAGEETTPECESH